MPLMSRARSLTRVPREHSRNRRPGWKFDPVSGLSHASARDALSSANNAQVDVPWTANCVAVGPEWCCARGSGASVEAKADLSVPVRRLPQR